MVVLLALLSTLAFAGSNVCVRRGTLWGPPASGVRLTILMGPPLFALLASSFGEMKEVAGLPWQAYLLFAAAGVVHFVLGRSLNYLSIEAMGASRATIVSNIAPVLSVIIAVISFGERPGWPVLVGGLLVLLGPLTMAQGERSARRANRGPGATALAISSRQLTRGILLSLAAAIFWGISPILIKGGLKEADFPVLGTFISYSAAAMLMSLPMLSTPVRKELVGMNLRGLRWYFLAGLSVSIAQLLRYLALSEGSVTLVVLLLQVTPIVTLSLTFLLNRSIESINRHVAAGGVLVVLGAVLIAWQG